MSLEDVLRFIQQANGKSKTFKSSFQEIGYNEILGAFLIGRCTDSPEKTLVFDTFMECSYYSIFKQFYHEFRRISTAQCD